MATKYPEAAMLNDTQCRSAKPKDKPYKLTDGNGLYLEVKPNGVKAWRYRFELAAKESIFAIGDYGASPAGETAEQATIRKNAGRFTLAEAREERVKARALVKQGINPAHQRKLDRIKREQANATTFEAVAREWVAMKDWEDATKTRRLSMLDRVVFPSIGKMPINQVTSVHVLEILTKTGKAHPAVAAEAKRAMSGIFDLAISTLRADTDPVYRVRKALPPNKTQHKRALSAPEIGKLLRDFAGHKGNFQTVTAFRLMWLTLCRPSEIIEAQWSEFDLDAAVWRIPAERMKMRKEHLVPLPTQAVELLRAMHGVTGRHTHVFPNRDDRTQPMTQATLRQALKKFGWTGKFSPHATRVTGSTRLNEMGYKSDWIERQLAHGEPNAVRATYNHAEYFEDRKLMMQHWADYLDALTAGKNVIAGKSGQAA